MAGTRAKVERLCGLGPEEAFRVQGVTAFDFMSDFVIVALMFDLLALGSLSLATRSGPDIQERPLAKEVGVGVGGLGMLPWLTGPLSPRHL